MLWESTEPGAALRERFGFASFDEAAQWVSAGLASCWRITVRECTRLVISDRNAILWATTDLGDVVVKWSMDRARFGDLDRSSRLLHELSGSGVPVATPVLTADGEVRTILDGPSGPISVIVLPELDGDWLDVGDRAAVHAAGACLARLHRALAAVDVGPWLPTPTPMPARIRLWLDQQDRGFAPEASLRLRGLLSGSPVLEDTPQLVHNDFRAANILAQDSEIVGVLDLDEVLVDHRVSDLAKGSTYLRTRFRSWAPTPITVQHQLRVGYESIRPLSPTESAWLPICTLWHGITAIPGADDTAGWAASL